MGTTLTTAQHAAGACLASPSRQQVALSPRRSPRAAADMAHVAMGLLPLKSRRNSSSSQRRCNSLVHDGTAPVPFSGHSSLTKGKALQSRTFHSKFSFPGRWGQDLMAPPSLCGTLSWVPTSSPSAMRTGGIIHVVLDSSQHRLIAAGVRPSRFVR